MLIPKTIIATEKNSQETRLGLPFFIIEQCFKSKDIIIL